MYNDLPRAHAGRRELSNDDLQHMRSKFGDSSRGDRDEIQVDLEGFRRFWKWFAPLMVTLKPLEDVWCQTSPVLIDGFISRHDAERKVRSD